MFGGGGGVVGGGCGRLAEPVGVDVAFATPLPPHRPVHRDKSCPHHRPSYE